MQHGEPIDYRNPAADSQGRSLPTWLKCAFAFVAGGVAIALFWYLQFLAYAPYARPTDMTSLLTDEGRAVARRLQLLCAVAVIAASSDLVVVWRRRPPPAA